MPRYPDVIGIDGDHYPGSRFDVRPALAISTGEHGDGADAEDVIRNDVGDWVLQPDTPLGQPEAVNGSAGRGASAWVPVVQWVGEAIANNVVDIAVGVALGKVLDRLREWRKSREAEGKYAGVEVSRGAAALLAGADLAREFGEHGPLEVEAVEEPSSIAGYDVAELSYVGLEPWIVLLRNMHEEVRYVVIVLPDGDVAGRLRIPFLEFEGGYLQESRFEGAADGG